MNRFAILAVILAASCLGQTSDKTVRDASNGKSSFPESTYSNLPPASTNRGYSFTVTDCATLACAAGGGTIKTDVRSDGSKWVPISGPAGGDGNSGGLGAQIQVKVGGLSAGESSIFSTGTFVQRAIECEHQSIAAGAVAALGATTSGEITLQTSISGDVRYEQIKVSETTQFVGSFTGLTISLGRSGSSNAEFTGAIPLMVSNGDVNYWSGRPIPPQLTGTYTIVAGFISTGANLSTASTGSVDIEICAYRSR
jgi:hypothetical protein